MFKLIKLAKTFYRLGELNLTNQNPKMIFLFNNFSRVPATTFQIFSNYCTGPPKNASLPGLNLGIDIEKLTQNDPEQIKNLQIIILEADVMRQEGSRVPDTDYLKQHHWQELLTKSRSQRKKYLEFLWKVEKKKQNEKSKREEAKMERQNRPEYVGDGHIRYGLNHNTFLLRIYDTTINHLYNSKLISALQFSQPLVIDCGYDGYMTTRECHNCAKQIMLAFSENRNHDEPFDLHLCNASLESPTLSALGRHIATLHEPWFPLTLHEDSYLTSKFPSIDLEAQTRGGVPQNLQKVQEMQKKRLVYLTPHCREEMREFDHDAVYVIGGIVDKVNQEPLSLAKAKKETLKMQKLPLDKYLSWGCGSGKSLTINQMVSILLDLRRTGDWEFALRHVPRRKVLAPNSITSSSERAAPSYDRRDRHRSFDNFRGKTDTKDLIKKLMN